MASRSYNEIVEALRELWGMYWALPPEKRPDAQVRIAAITHLVLEMHDATSKPLSNQVLQALTGKAVSIPTPKRALVEQGSMEQGWRRGRAL